jgi:hypothetical protein
MAHELAMRVAVNGTQRAVTVDVRTCAIPCGDMKMDDNAALSSGEPVASSARILTARTSGARQSLSGTSSSQFDADPFVP